MLLRDNTCQTNSVQPPVLIGSVSNLLFKQTGKMLRILKPQFVGNLAD